MNLSKETKQILILKLLEIDEDTKRVVVTKDTSSFIGQQVMVRTYSAGVHFGTLLSKVNQNAVLTDAHRVHYWDGACSLSQLAMEGTKKLDDCRISVRVDAIELDQVIEVCPMKKGVFEHLTSKIWKS